MLERDAMRWLQLTYKVPSEPSQKRVWVWRRLQSLVTYALQNSVYLLPYSEEVEKHFRQLAHEIETLIPIRIKYAWTFGAVAANNCAVGTYASRFAELRTRSHSVL